MSQNKENQQVEEIGKVAAILLGLVLFVFTAPVVILSGIFAYLIWASYFEREEGKWIRPLVIGAIGFLITKAAYQTFYDLLPQVLSSLATQTKIKGIMANEIIRKAEYGYIPLVIGVIYLLQNKLNPKLEAYTNLRLLVIKSFYPLRLIFVMGAGFAGVIAGIFGVKLDDNSSVVMGIFSFIVLSAISKVTIASALVLTHGTPFYLLAGGLSSAYMALFWYYFLTNKRRNDELPSNNWITKDIPKDGIKIGRLTSPRREDLKLKWSDINHHIHILGQPGAGKSVLLRNIYSHQIKSGEGLMMIDLKADISVREDFLSLAHHSNRMDDLIIIDLSHPESSYGYNPLQFGNATELKDKLIGAIVWSEPHYKRACESALLIVMRGLVWIRDNKKLTPTLEDVLTSLSGVSGLTALSELVEDDGIRQGIYLLITENKKELSKSIEGLKAEIGLMVMSEFGSIFKKGNSLNILEAIMSKKIILVNLDGQTYSESAKKFGRMLLGDLRAASGAIVTNTLKDERPKFTVVVDEFSDIVSTVEMAESFVGFLNRCRGSGIGVIIAHQSLGDFKDENSRKQIMDSTETFFSFVQKDPETCEILAATIGTEDKWKTTEQTRESILFSDKTGMGTRRLTQEYIYHPNVFKNLDTGVAVYAAKKPSRFGIVKVDMIYFERVNFAYEVRGLASENKNLDLSNRAQLKKKEFIDSLKNEQEIVRLDI
jgi:hypothetical protein